MSSGWMTWMCEMCGRVSLGPLARRAAATASSASRVARSPIAWKCGWKPSASRRGRARPQHGRVDHADAAVVGRPTVGVQVRVDHRTGEVLQDAVHHQLHAGRPVAPDGSRGTTVDELVDLLHAATALPPQRADDLGGQFASTGQGDVGPLLGLGGHDRVLPGRDPEGVQVRLPQRQGRLQVVDRRVGQELLDQRLCALLDTTTGRPVRFAVEAAVGRFRGPRRDPGDLERLRVDPGAVAVAAGQEDRSIGRDPVQVSPAGDAAREVVHGPAAALDPGHVGMRTARTPRRSRGTRRDRASRAVRSAAARGRRGPDGHGRRRNPGVTVRPRKATTRVLGPT